ncbi:MAG: regulatory iron-sulfur-containing complex subunit RicT [Deltaproteobacteria bacterium]|nr:regulatory iron-sulfur-containing complex subunit RicT [Deltaproteobacteria bacterium]
MTTPPQTHPEDPAGRRPRGNKSEPSQMRNTVVVVFGPVGRPLECDAGDMRLDEGQLVVVDDRRGGALARVVVRSARRVCHSPLARVLRVANETDRKSHEERSVQEQQALAFAREKARGLKLDVKMFRVEISPRRDRATVFFASEQRVDFRDLLRDLGAFLRLRVELRQVGVRDEAKMVGGIGSCGRELCCSTFLPKFEPISIRMAKSQNLALTPSKISGQCGRLKCCLVYEEAQYIEAAKGLPKIGKNVQTPDGVGRVQDLDILRGRIRVFFPDQPPQVFTADQVSPAPAPDARREPSREARAASNERPATGEARSRPGRREQTTTDEAFAAAEPAVSREDVFHSSALPAPEIDPHADDEINKTPTE